jgi:hypothetical protein
MTRCQFILRHGGSISNSVINALKKIEIEKMGISEFVGLIELLSIQYVINISPLSLSPKKLCRNRVKWLKI